MLGTYRSRVVGDLIREHGNVHWDGWPWRAKIRGAFVAPLKTARVARQLLSEITALPGDEFDNPQCMTTITVRSVRPRDVVVDVASDAGWTVRGALVERSPGRPWVRDVRVYPRYPDDYA